MSDPRELYDSLEALGSNRAYLALEASWITNRDNAARLALSGGQSELMRAERAAEYRAYEDVISRRERVMARLMEQLKGEDDG